MSHDNDSTPPAHTFFVAGKTDKLGRKYTYMMTAHAPEVDAFIRDISMANHFESPAQFEENKQWYPCLRDLTLWEVGVTRTVRRKRFIRAMVKQATPAQYRLAQAHNGSVEVDR